MTTPTEPHIDGATAELALAYRNAADLLEFTPAKIPTILRALRQQIGKILPPEEAASLLSTVFELDAYADSRRPEMAALMRAIEASLLRVATDIAAGKTEPSRAHIEPITLEGHIACGGKYWLHSLTRMAERQAAQEPSTASKT